MASTLIKNPSAATFDTVAPSPKKVKVMTSQEVHAARAAAGIRQQSIPAGMEELAFCIRNTPAGDSTRPWHRPLVYIETKDGMIGVEYRPEKAGLKLPVDADAAAAGKLRLTQADGDALTACFKGVVAQVRSLGVITPAYWSVTSTMTPGRDIAPDESVLV